MKSDSVTLKGELKKLLLLSVGISIVFVTLFAVQNFRTNIPQAANPRIIPGALCRTGLYQLYPQNPCQKNNAGGYNRMVQNNNAREYREARFDCFDGTSGRFQLASCMTVEQLKAAAENACTQLSGKVCLKSPTPTPSAQPPITPGNSPPVITTESLPPGSLGKWYSATVDAVDTNNDILSMRILSAPAWVNLGPCAQPQTGGRLTCGLTGNPIQEGFFKVYIAVTDNKNPEVSKGFSLQVVPNTLSVTPTASVNIPPRITTSDLPYGFVGYPYSSSVTAIDPNNDSLSMTISGLPSGLTQGPCAAPVAGGRVECIISGTPTFAGNFFVKVSVTDGMIYTSKEMRLSTYTPPRPSIIPFIDDTLSPTLTQ